jgi:HEAT repeat protein
MGLLRKVVRKSVRKVEPRSVRQVSRVVRHPVGTTIRAVTPTPIRQAERTVFNVTHPINTVENRAASAIVGPPGRYRTPAGGRSRRSSTVPPAAPPAGTDPMRALTFIELGKHLTASDLPSVDAALADPNDQIRYLALEYYLKLGGPDPRIRILRQLDDSAAIVRDLAFTKLRDFLAPDLKRVIERCLSDPSKVVRWTALEYLVELDPAAAVEHAKAQLHDNDATVRTLAASKLKYLSTHQPTGFTTSARAEKTTEHISAEARYGHARTLADQAEPSSRRELLRLSRDEDPMIRKLAIRGLARIKDPADHSVLVAALHDPSDDVRLEAARRVEIGSSEVLDEAVITATRDLHPEVRAAAERSVAQPLPPPQEATIVPVDSPLPHAIDEADPPDLVLALNVAAHRGEITVSVHELLDLLGRKRLTSAAVEAIEAVLYDAGLRAEPSLRKVDISGRLRLIQTDVIPEFAIRAHVDASGPWTLTVLDLLRAFDRSRMTDRARIEIAEALDYADLAPDPSISSVTTEGQITICRSGT